MKVSIPKEVMAESYSKKGFGDSLPMKEQVSCKIIKQTWTFDIWYLIGCSSWKSGCYWFAKLYESLFNILGLINDHCFSDIFLLIIA